jgi:hypothetical protein
VRERAATFSIDRAGKGLPKGRKDTLEKAGDEQRGLFHRT